MRRVTASQQVMQLNAVLRNAAGVRRVMASQLNAVLRNAAGYAAKCSFKECRWGAQSYGFTGKWIYIYYKFR